MTARLQDKRIWLGAGAVAAILIALVAWFGAISPQLSTASTTRADTDAAVSHNIALESANAKLKAENDQMAGLRGQLRTALTALPYDSGLPAFTRQLSQQATANRISLTSVVVGAATAAAGAATPVATAAPATGTTTTTTAPVVPAAASGGLVSIGISLISAGNGADQLNFLKAIQATGSRRALVTTTGLSPLNGKTIDGATTMTLQLTVFSAPLDKAGQAALEKLLSGN